jgi:threonine dehydrogenase-like Zn-dependent dehydrogenase
MARWRFVLGHVRLRDGKLVYHDHDVSNESDFEVELRVNFCGICGSDLKAVANNRFPEAVLGHEISATVVHAKTQKGKPGEIQEGRLATLFPILPCHSCPQCQRGEFRDCSYKKSLGFHVLGGFSSIIYAPIWNIRLLTRLANPKLAVLIEPVACVFRLITELSRSVAYLDADILIYGDGVMGVLCSRLLSMKGYKNVSIIGKYRSRLALASPQHKKIMQTGVNQAKCFGAIIVATDDPEAHRKSCLTLLRPSGVIFPLSRIQSDLLDEFRRSGGHVGRAFAYHPTDFDVAENLLATTQIGDAIISDIPLSLKGLPMFFENGIPKEKGLKFVVEC